MKLLHLHPTILLPLVVCAIAAAAEPTEVPIGVIAPFTGGSAPIAADMAKTIALLEERVNSAPGGRYRYRFIVEDSKGGVGAAALSAFNKIRSGNRIQFLITGISAETLQVAPAAERARVLTVAVASSSPDVKKAGDFIFRTYVDIERGVDLMLAQLQRDGRRRVALISEDSVYTKPIEARLIAGLGAKLAVHEEFLPDEMDFRTQLLRIKASSADALYLNCGGSKTCAALYAQTVQVGLKLPRYSYYYPEQPDVQASAAGAVEGITYFSVPEVKDSVPEYRELVRQFERRFGAPPNTRFISQAAYDAAKVIIDGVEKVGPDAAKVKDFLYRYDAPGALGRVRFDESGDVRDIAWVLKRIHEGRVELFTAPAPGVSAQ